MKDPELRAFLERVASRMAEAGAAADTREAAAYIVEQAVMEGRSQGYQFADNRFLTWVDRTFGKPIGDLLRRFIGLIRQWMMRHGLGLKRITVDDLVAYAMAGVERAARGDVGGQAGHSRSESTRAAYERRIDELYAGGKPNTHGVRVLDRSDVLDLLGYGGLPVHVAEGKVIDSRYNHGLTAEHWKKIPSWLENPVAVFDSATRPGRLVFIAPEAVRGAPLVMIVEPKTTLGRAAVHLLVNAYGKTGGRTPVQQWIESGLLLYLDEKQSPVVGTTTGLQLPRVVHQQRGSKTKVFTQRDLVKFRQARAAGQQRFSLAIPDTIEVDGVQRPTRNSEGRLIHPTEEGIRNFWRWFADSKVVDRYGRPLIVYHGTSANIDAFRTPAFFAGEPEVASAYAGRISSNVVPVYLRISNPLRMDDIGDLEQVIGDSVDLTTFDYDWEALESKKVIGAIKGAGYDGVYFTADAMPDTNETHSSWVVFENTQIKSAVGNVGTFDPANPDIRFSRAGLRTIARRATAEINQALNAPGKVHWWHKTVGTMYNLAERAPAFKPVFEAAQSFIEDVSYYAADASERAPHLLPRLDTWRDLFKTPISAADNVSIVKPISREHSAVDSGQEQQAYLREQQG